MTTTPTPGAASELLTVKFTDASVQGMVDALTNIRRTVQKELRGAVAKDIFDFADEALSALTRTPAPVTEGAQREAVAYIPTKSLEWMRNGDMDFCTVRRHDSFDEPSSPLFATPPPPDRVQPERVEAVLTDDEIAQKVIDLVGPLCDRGTFEAPDWAIAVVHATIYRNDPTARLARSAPPTDASGGVTDAMVRAAADAYLAEVFLPEDIGDTQDQLAMKLARKVLEAADRARKPETK